MEENKEWIDIPDLAKKLQVRAENILKDWFPNGKKLGNEFLVGSLNGESGQSLRINIETGKWADFSNTTDRGGDLVSLYAAKNKITNVSAAKVLSDEFGIRVKREKKLNGNGHENGSNVVGIYDPFADKKWGAPTGRWTYYKDGKPYFHVCRYERVTDDGKKSKTYRQLVQREDGVWIVGLKSAGITKPYPIFSDKIETDTVLIVEGEKACVAARGFCPHNVVTWFGGVANVKNADWSPVYGKKIIIWPDNDGPGHEASQQIKTILKEHCSDIRIVETSKFEDKWDAYDFAQAKKLWTEITFQKHGALDLSLNSRGDPYINEHNVDLILSHEETYRGNIWYDEFRQKRMIKDKAFRDEDYSEIVVFFQRKMNMHGMSSNIVHGGVKFHCHKNRKNPVKEYYQDLDKKWDGKPRIKYFMSEAYGAKNSSYNQEVSKNFFLAMIARILTPGCKFDHMIVLEGHQGYKKSTSLKELVGEEFYWDCAEPMGSKDFLRGLKGKIIVELSELNSILKSDVDMVKKTLSCSVDEYIEKYQIENVVIPRTCVFVGTTNENEYLMDATGNRRFWPVKIEKEVDLEYIKANREQLFAEASYRLKNGETYWEFKEEESKKEVVREQQERLVQDEWMEVISEVVALTTEVSMSRIFEKLNIPPEKANSRESHRVGRCLKMLGFKRITKRDGDKTKRVWVKD